MHGCVLLQEVMMKIQEIRFVASMKINSARAGCNRPRPSETLRQRWGLAEWDDMQRGGVHVVLVVL
ncbi:hypothetical protein B9J09_11665 [Xylella fastidiosa subsp. pauca]|nr:hypothetical protein B9J09_11665 [Xylella fastidiosa subsp. pauca]AVI21578.1 hypothetical protein BCV75_10905 [Xylella fastidiosa]AVI23614.1 hypothetical protein BC375_10970 [Xylella fastidiosa]KIA57426.1 hypothetical protein RA12_10960 [Xylella fastidiosa]KXB10613.1 hypothetical protein ADT32_07535 [Xylella fastidiosa]